VGKIAVLLSTYNGSKYIKSLLNSLFLQTYGDFTIIARDDGSNDNTSEILKTYSDKIDLLNDNKNYGIKKSFEILLNYALKEGFEYFMFCDQDDVWKEDKVEISYNAVKNKNIPFLVHTDLEIVDENLKTIDASFWHYQYINPAKNQLNRLLMQNTVTGCSMTINKHLAKKILQIPDGAVMHDWWIALAASVFGEIKYLNYSTVLYRQHKNNNIGANNLNIKYVLDNLFYTPLQKLFIQAKSFYKIYFDELSLNQKILLEEFIDLPNKSFIEKRKTILKYRFLKHGFIRNLGLMVKI